MSVKITLPVALLTASLFMLGCAGRPTNAQITKARVDLETAWTIKNDMIRALEGTREYAIPYKQAYLAAGKALLQLGLNITLFDAKHGTVEAEAKAPIPLNDEEWAFVVKEDTPEMHEIIAKAHPILPKYWNLTDLDSYRTILLVGVVDRGGSVLVTVDYRSYDIHLKARAKTKAVNNVPPSAAKIGLMKWWNIYEDLLGKGQMSKPAPITL